jgi:hypothetical protein
MVEQLVMLRAFCSVLLLTVLGCGSETRTPQDAMIVPPDMRLIPLDFKGADLASIDTLTVYVHDKSTLYIVNPTTFALTTVGMFGAGDDMTDLAVTPDGQIYTISRTSMYTVDRNTGQATLLLSNISTSNVALTFQIDGTLLASDKDGLVRRINPTNGMVTELGQYGQGWDTAGDLVSVSDGTMFGIAANGPMSSLGMSNVLLKVDPTSGVATGVGPIGYTGVFGTAYSNGRVLAFTRDGQIVQIDPTTGQGTLVMTHTGKDFWGAGTSPLVPIN